MPKRAARQEIDALFASAIRTQGAFRDLKGTVEELSAAINLLAREREKLTQQATQRLGAQGISITPESFRQATEGTGRVRDPRGRFVPYLQEVRNELDRTIQLLNKYEFELTKAVNLGVGPAAAGAQGRSPLRYGEYTGYGYYPGGIQPQIARISGVSIGGGAGGGAGLFSGVDPNDVRKRIETQVIDISKALKGKFDIPEFLGITQDLDRFTKELEKAGVAYDSLALKFKESAAGKQVDVEFKKGEEVIDRFIAKVNSAGKLTTPYSQEAFSPDQINRLASSYATAFELATKYGFQRNQLNDVEEQANSGVTRLTFAYRDQEGVYRKLIVNVDEYGRAFYDSQKRLRSFGSTIVRNIREVAGWSVAISLVYGPLYKLRELVTTSIDNQTRLAEVSVLLGNAQRDLNDIFSDAARVAQATGQDINGVLTAYADAYRAVGAISDPIERTTAANKLLTDAVTLASLSTLDQTEAIDVLSGSLRQLQGPSETFNQSLERSSELLDKWVYLSTTANVSLETLATGFSITAESGVGAFDDVDEGINFVNASIASLSEKIGSLGAEETGNAIRAIIAGFSSDKASAELEKFGVSVKDSEGRLRSWIDIASEISLLFQQGVLSPDQLNQIAFAIGGGNRRGQQVRAFLSDLERINQLATQQSDTANIQGIAQQALSVKLETVNTSLTKLNNSFQSLAQTLGTDGGILDLIITLVDAGTSLVDIFDSVAGSLGKITVPLLAFGAGAAYFSTFPGGLSYQGGVAYDKFRGKLGAPFGGAIEAGALGLASPFQQVAPGISNAILGAGGRLAGGVSGAVSRYGLGTLAAIPSAASFYQQGELDRAGAVIGAAVVGTVIAGGNPIGGIIGTAIADFFLSTILENKSTWRDFLTSGVTEPGETEDQAAARREREARQARERGGIYGEAGRVLGGGGLNDQLYGRIITSIIGGATQLEGIFGAPIFPNLRQTVGLPEEGALSGQQIAGALAPDVLKQIQSGYAVQAEGETFLRDYFVTDLQGQIQTAIEEQARRFAEQRRGQLFQEFLGGDVASRQYKTSRENLQTLTAFASRILAAGGGEFEALTGKESQEILQNLFETITQLTPEARQELSQLATEISTLYNQIEEAKQRGATEIIIGADTVGLDEAETRLQQWQQDLVATQTSIQRQLILDKEELPQLLGLGARIEDLPLILAEYQNVLGSIFAQLTPTEREKKEAELKLAEAIVETVDGAGRTAYQRLEGIDTSYLQTAYQNLIDEGLLAPPGGIDFQRLDISRDEFLGTIVPRYNQTLGQLRGLGYDPLGENIESLITLFESGEVEVNRFDWKVIQLLMEENNDLQRKQLDGIYNLPTDASFYVPFTGYRIGPFEQGTTGIGGGVPTTTAVGEPYRSVTRPVGIRPDYTREDIDQFRAFLEENPEARFAKGFVAPGELIRNLGRRESAFSDTSFRDIASNAPTVVSNITLESTHNVTLLIDRTVLASIIAEQLGRTIATTRGLAGSNTRFQAY